MPRWVIRLNTVCNALTRDQLVSDRKEPSEILEAYDSVKLGLSGNSTHLVPWHTKLGFRRCASVCTLSSLTSDGGNIAMMNLRIEKVSSNPITNVSTRETSSRYTLWHIWNSFKTRMGSEEESDRWARRRKWLRGMLGR